MIFLYIFCSIVCRFAKKGVPGQMLKILYYVKTTNTQIHRKAQHRNPTATMMQCSWDVGWATDVELFLSFILHKEKLMGICVCARSCLGRVKRGRRRGAAGEKIKNKIYKKIGVSQCGLLL